MLTFDAVFPLVIGLFLAMVVSRLAIVSVGAAFEPMSPRTKASAQSRPPPSRCSASSSGSRSRVHWSVFDTKRSLVVQEANAIGTAYLRLDLAPAPDQPALRQLFRQYLDARIRVFCDTTRRCGDRSGSGRGRNRPAADLVRGHGERGTRPEPERGPDARAGHQRDDRHHDRPSWRCRAR
jgi:hypothetical protein